MKDKISLFDLPDDDKRGVSPVIGVILMVAITVILAAVIASFVLGFGGSVNSNASAGVDVDNDANNVTIISMGDNTKKVICRGSTDTDVGTQVGDSASCNDGDNVVAIGDSGANNATIRTDI